jgi:TIR domain-containing protein
MIIHLITFLVASSSIILLSLILRFVEPELIYIIRKTLTRVRMNKVFLEYDENRIIRAATFPALLIDDFRTEARAYDDDTYIIGRINKIRELYRLIVSRRPMTGLTTRPKPQVLVRELVGLIDGLGRNVSSEGGLYHSTVDASSLLAFIGNGIRVKEGLPPLDNPRGVEAWLTANPISFEQVIEILIAAVFSLAYRQHVHDNPSIEEASAEKVERASAKKREDIALEKVKAAREAEPAGTEKTGSTSKHASSLPTTSESREAADDEASAVALSPSTSPTKISTPTGNELVIKIFISYSHRDSKYLKDNSLIGYLRGLEQEGVEFWDDEDIIAGEKWDEKIKARISDSHIALILVSQAYLDSEYCRNEEINRFLIDTELRGLSMLPIMLSRCEWERHEWLRSRRFLPGSGQTIEDNYIRTNKRTNLFYEIRQHLRRHIEAIRSGYRHPQSD